jgi:hypothetical protein
MPIVDWDPCALLERNHDLNSAGNIGLETENLYVMKGLQRPNPSEKPTAVFRVYKTQSRG